MSLATGSRLQRRRNFFRRLRIYAYISGVVGLLVGIVYLCTSSPLLKIQSIRVVSPEVISEDEVILALKKQVASRPIAGWFGADSYFAWPTDLAYSAPHIATIIVTKSFWSRSITVSVVPRDRYAVWCVSEVDCLWIDSTGTAFEYAPIAEGQLVQTIFESGTSTPILLGDTVLAPSSFAVVTESLAAVRELAINVQNIILNRELQELQIRTAGGALIRLSLRFDPKITAIPAIRRFGENPGFSSIEYLNLTVENRAYVKYR